MNVHTMNARKTNINFALERMEPINLVVLTVRRSIVVVRQRDKNVLVYKTCNLQHCFDAYYFVTRSAKIRHVSRNYTMLYFL